MGKKYCINDEELSHCEFMKKWCVDQNQEEHGDCQHDEDDHDDEDDHEDDDDHSDGEDH